MTDDDIDVELNPIKAREQLRRNLLRPPNYEQIYWYYKLVPTHENCSVVITRPFRAHHLLVWPDIKETSVITNIKIGVTEQLAMDVSCRHFHTKKPKDEFPEEQGEYNYHQGLKDGDPLLTHPLQFKTANPGEYLSVRFAHGWPEQVVLTGSTIKKF